MVILTFDDGGKSDTFKLTNAEFDKINLDDLDERGELTISFVEEMCFTSAKQLEEMLREEELKNTVPICPECGSETYTAPADTDYYNIWCCDPKQECEWFTEVDIVEGV